jgi:hypothetical protein
MCMRMAYEDVYASHAHRHTRHAHTHTHPQTLSSYAYLKRIPRTLTAAASVFVLLYQESKQESK